MEMLFFNVLLVVVMFTSSMEGAQGTQETNAPCPSGCRCSSPAPLPVHAGRNRWHRLLAAYRLRATVYGSERAGQGWDIGQNHDNAQVGKGREVTCVGLSDIPYNLPSDVSKLVMYGDSRTVTESDQIFLGDDPNAGSAFLVGNGRPMTSLFKRALIPSSGTITELTVEGNKIRSLSDHSLDVLGELIKLRLRNNKMRTLTPGALMGLLKLQELDLSQNQFTKISRTTFYSLVNLKKLLINQNSLKALHTRTFKPLVNLEELDLSGNRIHYMGKKIFWSNTELIDLNLNNNNLKVLQPEWFQRLRSLTRLSLQGNQFTSLPALSFRSLQNLRHLSLDHNSIAYINPEAFTRLPQLLTLKLTKNNLSVLEPNVFQELEALQELSLKENSLENLVNGTFFGLGELKELDLSRNRLTQVGHDALVHVNTLHHLDLSHNQIKTISRRNFFGLHELRELKLDHNMIGRIEEEGFAVSVLSAYSKLTWLYLDHNQLDTISEYTLYGLAYVKYLNLGYNGLHTVEEGGLSKLGRLHTLLLNDNSLQQLDAGIFEHLTYLHHLNLGANRIRNLAPELFNRLEKLEDINLMDNNIEDIVADTFLDTPHLTSINLRKNRLQSVDLSILDNSPKLKYLDVSKNIISHIDMPIRFRRQLYYLSLADNNFLHLPPEVEKSMAFNGDLHLYGNPWSCDCGLRWLTELDDRRLKLPLSDEIVCKSPSSLTGEQIMRLEPSDFVCVMDDYDAEDWPRDDPLTHPGLACDFMDHAAGQNDRTEIKSNKDDLMDWMVLFLNEDDTLYCAGFRLSNHWVLTKSECWKHWGYDRSIMVKFGSTIDPHNVTEDDLTYQYTDIEEISHYHGTLDIALVRLGYVREENEKRVFPCILSEDGIIEAEQAEMGSKVHGIMTAKATYMKNLSKVKFRGFPFKVLPASECSLEDTSKLCIIGNDRHPFGDRYDMHDNFFFTKVGRSKWALGGVNIMNLGEHVMTEDHQMTIASLHVALRWIEQTLLY